MNTLDVKEIKKQYEALRKFKGFWPKDREVNGSELGYYIYTIVDGVSLLAKSAVEKDKKLIGRCLCNIFLKLYYFCKAVDVDIFEHFTSDMEHWTKVATDRQVETITKEKIEKKWEKEKKEKKDA